MEQTDERKRQETLTFLDGQAKARTIEGRSESWLANVKANRKHFAATPNPPLQGLTAFVVAAGPSLNRNAKLLQQVGKLGVVICVEAAYRHLLSVGVVPEYCVTLDADARMLSMVEGCDTRRTTLVAQASASPALVDYWQGPKYFLRATGGTPDLDAQLHAATRVVKAKRALVPGETLEPTEDVEVVYPGLSEALACGGNVTTYAHVFALTLLNAVRVVFVGADYAWRERLEGEDDDAFYAGGQHQKLARERLGAEQIFSHKSPFGEVATNFTLYHLKDWHEKLAEAKPGHAVNATEGGILGVDKNGASLPGWEHMTLAAALEKYAPAQAVPA